MRAISLLIAVLCAALLPGSGAAQDRSIVPEQTIPAALEPLRADQLVSWVLERNPGLFALQAAAEAAAHRIVAAGSLDDPTLSYAVAPLTADADRSLNQKIDVSQRIPWPGTLAARERAARHEAAAAEMDLDALRLRVVAQARSAHAEWWYVTSALSVHHETRSLLDELQATAQSRYAAGRAPRQDALQAEIERTGLDNHLLLLLRQRSIVQARINALLNRSPEAPLPPAAPPSLRPTLPTLDKLASMALAHQPELSRLDAEISADESRITLAEKASYPDFQVGVGYNSLWDPTDKRPVLAVSINVPLNRSRRRSELDIARAELRRTKFSLSERRAQLLADLAATRARAEEARDSVNLYAERLAPLAAEYLAAAVDDYESGSGAFLNVISAEQNKLETDLKLARVRADYARHLAELELWTGRPLAVPYGEQP